jgi:hypothetical protein
MDDALAAIWDQKVDHSRIRPFERKLKESDPNPHEAHSCRVLLAANIAQPCFLWLRYDPTSTAPHQLRMRDFARGGDMSVVVERVRERSDAPQATAVTIHWKQQQLLAGESQFSQLMYTIFGNLREEALGQLGGSKPLVPIGQVLPDPINPAEGLSIPSTCLRTLIVNVCFQDTAFRIEHGDDRTSGEGTFLVNLHLDRARVQFTLHNSGPQRILVASQGVTISTTTENPTFRDLRDPQAPTIGEHFVIIDADVQVAKTLSQPGRELCSHAHFQQAVNKLCKQHAFCLDYAIHSRNAAPGPHCIEVSFSDVAIAWPFLGTFDLVQHIVQVYSRCFGVDWIPPNLMPDGQRWMFVNVVMTGGSLFALATDPVDVYYQEYSQPWCPALQAEWSVLRVGYDWASDGERVLLADFEDLSAFIVEDSKHSDGDSKSSSRGSNRVGSVHCLTPCTGSVQWHVVPNLKRALASTGVDTSECDQMISLPDGTGNDHETMCHRHVTLRLNADNVCVQLDTGTTAHISHLLDVVRGIASQPLSRMSKNLDDSFDTGSDSSLAGSAGDLAASSGAYSRSPSGEMLQILTYAFMLLY